MFDILIFGTGSGMEKVKKSLNMKKTNIIAYADNDNAKVGQRIDNIDIINPSQIQNISYDYIIIASQYHEIIYTQLTNLKVCPNKIIEFFRHPVEYIYFKYPIFMNKGGIYEDEFWDIYEKCYKYTMTGHKKMYALYKATEYVIKNNIKGDFVECGVWKGGSTMVSALTFLKNKDNSRKIYLYDTFEGMSEPGEEDKHAVTGKTANQIRIDNGIPSLNDWCYSQLDETKFNVYSTGYEKENITFVKGKVEETIPEIVPEEICILRLDTDWYESTYHELKYLYPKLVHNGVVIFDDYGFWKGHTEAVDKYFKENNINLLLTYMSECGVIGVKI